MKKNDIFTILGAGVCFAAGIGAGMLIQKKKDEEVINSYDMALKNELVKRNMTLVSTSEGEPEPVDETSETPEYDEPQTYTMHDISDMMNVITSNGYSDSEEIDKTDLSTPRVISPDDVGNCGYETGDYMIFADGRISNGAYELVPKRQFELAVGPDALTHFGEYEEDSVYVRNDKLKMDIGIFKDLRKYTDVVGQKPHLVDDLINEEE